MNCRSFERQAADWLSSRLSPERSQEMAAHQKTCVSCARAALAESQFRERWRDEQGAADAADLWPRLALRLETQEQSARREKKGIKPPAVLRRPQWAVATVIALAAVGISYWGRLPINSAAIQRTAHQDHKGLTDKVSAEIAAPVDQPSSFVQSHASAWATLGTMAQNDPTVDDPVGTSMENVWICLKTDGK